jgi:hypothetical protein
MKNEGIVFQAGAPGASLSGQGHLCVGRCLPLGRSQQLRHGRVDVVTSRREEPDVTEVHQVGADGLSCLEQHKWHATVRQVGRGREADRSTAQHHHRQFAYRWRDRPRVR